MSTPRMDAAIRWLPLGLGSCAALLFSLLTPPSFFWLDSAELTAGGVGLGSPHPTGFPLYMMVAKMASLVPFGEISHRINLLSALLAGLCVGLVARLVIGAGRSNLAALSGAGISAAALSSSLLFARHAVVAEVYVATAVLFAAVLATLDRAVRTGSARLGLLLAALCGLGLGLHSSFRILLVVPVVYLCLRQLRRGARWPLYAPVLALGVAAALHLYLPVRSSVGSPALDWGHPETLGNLSDHVSASRIRASFADEIASSTPEVVSVNLASFSSEVTGGLGPATIVLAALGLAWLATRRRSRLLALALGVAVLIDFVYGFWINPMGTADGQNGIFLAVAAAALAGLGATWFLARSGRAAPFIGAFVALLVALAPASETFETLAPAARNNAPRAVADEAMNRLPSRAIALCQSDSLAAASIYLTEIEGARPDIAVLVRQQLADKERTRAVAGLADTSPATFRALAKTGRPIAWELGDDQVPAGAALVAGVPFSVLARDGIAGDIQKAIERTQALFSLGPLDVVSARRLARGLTNLGRIAYKRRRFDLASRLFDAAITASPTYASALVNRGVIESGAGNYEAALSFTRLALSAEPNRITALINSARYEHALGNVRVARSHLVRALAVEPQNKRARALLESLE